MKTIKEDTTLIGISELRTKADQVFKVMGRSTDPKAYGHPLRDEFAGLRKLRVGDYRVVYRIIQDRVEVLVLKIGIRRDFEIYRQLVERLKRI